MGVRRVLPVVVSILILGFTLTTVPLAFAVQIHPGNMIVVDIGEFVGEGKIIQVDPETGDQTIISTGGLFDTPIDIALDSNGDIIVVDPDAFGGSGGIIRVDPTTGVQTEISSGGLFVDPDGVAIDSNGDFFVTDIDGFSGNGFIIKVDHITKDQSFVTIFDDEDRFSVPAGIVIDDNGFIFVADLDAIIKVDPTNGDQEIISSDFSPEFAPLDLTIDANGDIVVATLNITVDPPVGGNIVRVDPETGDQTEISSGDLIVSPSGVTIDFTGKIILDDFGAFGGTGGIIRINPISGSQTTISSGGFFFAPVAVLVVPQVENETITICHKEKVSISVSEITVSIHLNHGDTLGMCT